MNYELAIVLVLLAAAIAMFAINRPRMDVVALIMLTVLPFTGVITMAEALAGFSDSTIVLLAALFVIGEGLVRTGVAQQLGDWLNERAGSSERRLLVLLMTAVAGLGAFMSSTGVVAIFIPVTLRIAQNTGTAPSQLMMPLSVAALISGMLSLIATAPNLVVHGELARHGSEGFKFFSFTPFGLPVLIVGIIYMLFARRWLPAKTEPGVRAGRPTLRDWIERYHLADREYRVRVTAGSPLIGKTVAEIDMPGRVGASLVTIERKGRRRFASDVIAPTQKTELQAGDVLLVDLFAPKIDIETLRQRFGLEALPLTGAYFSDRSQDIGMAEVMVAADSELAGKTLVEVAPASRYGLTVIGLRRGPEALARGLNERLRVGDTLLVIGRWKEIDRLRFATSDVLVLNLPTELEDVLPVAGKAPHALFCLVLMVTLMVSGVVPNVQAALIACLLMGALGCMDLESAYRSIHWKTLVLIVGMLPFSIALQKTGGVDLAADALMAIIGGAGTYGVLASLFAVTALLGLFISNTATAVLMAPVALAVADEIGASPYPFAMIVALAASTAFMTPISSPVNTLVVAPGDYSFGDFLRVGVPFSVLVLIVSVLLVPLLLPLYPH